jgi:hypothetical protein
VKHFLIEERKWKKLVFLAVATIQQNRVETEGYALRNMNGDGF